MARKQVVVIGAGMGGMITAALLAREADMDVLVLEKEQVIGGRTMSFGGHHGQYSEKEYKQILRGASSVHVLASSPSVQEIIEDHDLFNTWIIDAGWHGVSSGNRSR
jgi:phytoene dehydrogenase-like protein